MTDSTRLTGNGWTRRRRGFSAGAGARLLAALMLATLSLALAPSGAYALGQGTSIFGTVTDSTTNQPLAGATLWASGGDLWEWELVATTDTEGRYEVQVPTGVYGLRCYASSQYAEKTVEQVAADPSNPSQRDFALVPYTKAFYGWVKNASTGNPVAGMSVMLEADAASGFAFTGWTKTDAAGYYEFYAPNGTFDLRVAGTGFQAAGAQDLRFAGPAAVRHDFSLKLPKTKATVSTVSASRYSTRYYRLYGLIKPRHASKTYPVRVYRWKAVGSTWKPYGYLKGAASTYSSSASRYSVKYRFPSTGKWRLQAVAPEDAAHTRATSGYSYVKVR